MRYVKVLVFSFAFVISFPSLSQDEESGIDWMSFNGYLKYMQTLTLVPDTSLFVDNLLHNRLNFDINNGGASTLKVQFRNRIFYGDNVRNIPGYGELVNQYDGVLPLEWLITDNESVVMSVIVDRLFYEYASEKWQIRLGRQRINWGINTTWNPNDIFNSYNIYDFDYEEREGSDAIRVQYYPNYNSSVDFAYKFTDSLATHVAAIRYNFNKNNYDYQFLAGKFQEKIAVGGGWAGNIKLIGFKGELTYFHPYTDEGIANVSMSTALDYSWQNGFYLMGTYLLNTSGTNDVTNPSLDVGSVPTAENLMPSKHNAMANASYQLSPIMFINMGVVYGFGINSLVVFPTYTINLKSNFDLDIIGQVFFQELPEESIQNLGNGIFGRLKWSF
ncbi:MAG: hypothetical protein JXR07_11520 [Reichenbachiella sp.]